ncbi:MAG: hypothetical protein JW390_10273 [Nitrosopumilus sp.]|nr:hypothetical protein [Candidatus Nitrosopumilus limneticus]
MYKIDRNLRLLIIIKFIFKNKVFEFNFKNFFQNRLNNTLESEEFEKSFRILETL